MALTLHVDDELTLRLVQPEHAEAIFAAVDADREHLGRFLPWVQATRSPADTERWVRGVLREFGERRHLPLSVLRDGALIGGVGFNAWRLEHHEAWSLDTRTADVGYWLNASACGSGVMTRCVRRLCDLAFEDYAMHRLTIRAEPANRASAAVAERAGFTLEGTLRHVHTLAGRAVDHRLYAITRGDWDQRRDTRPAVR